MRPISSRPLVWLGLLLVILFGGFVFFVFPRRNEPPPAPLVTVTAAPWSKPCMVPYFIVRNNQAAPLALEQVVFAYGNEQSYRLPARQLAPGQAVRVWSGTGTDDDGNIYAAWSSEHDWPINGFRPWLETGDQRMKLPMGFNGDEASASVFLSFNCDPTM